MIARDPRTTWDYVLQADRALPKEQRTVFHLGHLSVAEEHETLDRIHVGTDATTAGEPALVIRHTGSRALEILRAGLRGWTNMKNAAGQEIAFEGAKGKPSDADLMRLPLSDRMELSRAIEGEVEVTEAELGKSEPPSA